MKLPEVDNDSIGDISLGWYFTRHIVLDLRIGDDGYISYSLINGEIQDHGNIPLPQSIVDFIAEHIDVEDDDIEEWP